MNKRFTTALIASSLAIISVLSLAQSKFPVTVTHDFGQATFQKIPTRIVAVGEELVDLLFALEVFPNGVASDRAVSGNGFTLNAPVPNAGYFKRPFYSAAPYLGLAGTPNTEALIAFKPDLILSYNDTEAGHAILSKIAPTLTFKTREPNWWRERLPKLAALLGRDAQATAFVNRYDARAATLKKSIAPTVKSTPRVVVLFLPSATDVFLFDRRSIIAQGLAELGFTLVVPSGVTVGPVGTAISIEALATIQADRAIALRYPNSSGKFDPLPAEAVLEKRGIPLLRYALDSTEPSSGPTTDLKRLEEFTKLLMGAK